MNQGEQLNEAEQNSRVNAGCTLITFTLAVELFLLLMIVSFFQTPGVTPTAKFLALAGLLTAPFVSLHFWRQLKRKRFLNEIAIPKYVLPYHIRPLSLHKMNYIILDEEEIRYTVKLFFVLTYTSKTVSYCDIKDLQFSTSGGRAYLQIYSGNAHQEVDVINLSECAKEDWVILMNVLSAKCSSAKFNTTASALSRGSIPV